MAPAQADEVDGGGRASRPRGDMIQVAKHCRDRASGEPAAPITSLHQRSQPLPRLVCRARQLPAGVHQRPSAWCARQRLAGLRRTRGLLQPIAWHQPWLARPGQHHTHQIPDGRVRRTRTRRIRSGRTRTRRKGSGRTRNRRTRTQRTRTRLARSRLDRSRCTGIRWSRIGRWLSLTACDGSRFHTPGRSHQPVAAPPCCPG